ncbi:hypothetical protein [Streptomyces sp. NPDC059970]|uniref:hypothetical protein n=1 Tax=Streptomyces sp. NPDC059970 TaxID=3347019 RepID=UPI00368D5150
MERLADFLLMPMVLEVTAKFGQGHVHHVGIHPKLEDQMVTWVAGMATGPLRVGAARGLPQGA